MKVRDILIIVVVVILIIAGFCVYKINSSKEVIENNNTEQENFVLEGNAIDVPEVEREIPESEYGRNINKVNLEVDIGSLTRTGTKLIITDTNETAYFWGPGFKLQVKNNDKWEDVPLLTTVAFDSNKYELDENSQTIEEIDWTEAYGELGAGTYRIVKPQNDNGYLELYSNEFIFE